MNLNEGVINQFLRSRWWAGIRLDRKVSKKLTPVTLHEAAHSVKLSYNCGKARLNFSLLLI